MNKVRKARIIRRERHWNRLRDLGFCVNDHNEMVERLRDRFCEKCRIEMGEPLKRKEEIYERV